MVSNTIEVILVGLGLTGLTAIASCRLTRRLARATGFGALDHPGIRSLHSTPTPRTGGIAILSTLTVSSGIGAAFALFIEQRGVELGEGLGIVCLATAVLAAHSYW